MCSLVSGDQEDSNNQHFRLCVAVLRSSYFADKIQYPENLPSRCSEKKISFRSVETLAEGGTESFYERMTQCYSEYLELSQGPSHLYISRSYLSNSIFVYRRDPYDRKIYLENLSTNISIVDELNSFDFVEY